MTRMEASNNQGRTIRFRVRGEVKFEEEEKQGGAFHSLEAWGVWGADRVGEWVIIVQIDSDYCSNEYRIWLGFGL